MRLGLELSTVSGDQSGVGTYASQLKKALETYCPQIEIVPLIPDEKKYDSKGKLVNRLVSKFNWFVNELPGKIKEQNINLVHYTNPFGNFRLKVPFVVTLHDACLQKYPEAFPFEKRLFTKKINKYLVNNASRIITVSNTSARQIMEQIGIHPDKLDVIKLAASSEFSTRILKKDIDEVKKKYSLPERYVFFYGAIDVRKNLQRLTHASEIWREQEAHSDVELILAGPYYFTPCGEDSIREFFKCYNVRHLGYLPREELPVLIKNASVVAYPSVCEGFGLPVLEAMMTGTPVLTSINTATAEVAQEAAVLVDPWSIDDIAGGVIKLLEDPDDNKDLIKKAKTVAKNYSWRKVAEQTVRVYEKALKQEEF